MKMSEKKRQQVYSAISNSIMDCRIEIKKERGEITALAIDGKLFNLEREIWKRVKMALAVEGI